ncbi:MAG: tRNA pseudouridine(13) synthase TruD [Myxococcaceae bacterium]|nr:tRNA pseudouridine(13) synthase TruD [Myxococcaceae bacterium]
MKIKQRPEDFSVKESYRFVPVETGRFRVYLMDKQKLSTFDAVERIRERFGLRPGAISFCGLKDKQGRTEQLIAVDGADVDLQDRDLRLKYLGRYDRPLSAENLTSNRFSVTVRALTERDLDLLPASAAEVNRLGVVNYFDSQRFGSLKHGQGFIAKDLIRGDFEAALRNYMARPSPLDRTQDAKVKEFWRANWGHWEKKAPPGNQKYYRILRVLRESPRDFVNAFLQIDASYRALLLFTYQSYLWNEGVRRLLQLMFPREHLFPMPYQAGSLLFHKDASADTLRELRAMTFPLLAPDSAPTDPRIKSAVEWVLGKEKLKLSDLRIEEAPQRLFFKHEERPVLIYPHKLVLGRPGRDEFNRGLYKLNVAFTLPPGAYATLVIKRLFHFAWLGDDQLDPATHQAPRTGPPPPPERPGRPGRPASNKRAEPGFLERQRLKKAARQKAREMQAKQAKSKGKRS